MGQYRVLKSGIGVRLPAEDSTVWHRYLYAGILLSVLHGIEAIIGSYIPLFDSVV